MRARRLAALALGTFAGLAGPCGAACAQGGELIDLMPRLQEGARVRYEVTFVTSTRGTGEELPEGGLTAKTTLNATVSLEVREFAHDEALVSLNYERIRLSIDPGLAGLGRSFDTGGPPEAVGEPGPSLRLLIGAPSALRVAGNGEVREVEPPDGVAPAPGRGAVLKAFTTSQGIREWLGPAMTVHAADRVAPVGSRWSHEQRREVLRGTEVRTSTSYHLSAATGGQATVGLDGSGTLVQLGAAGGAGGARELDLKEMKLEGLVLWDLAAGVATQVDAVETEVWTSQPAGRAVTTASVERRLMIRRLTDGGDVGGQDGPGAEGAK